MPAIKSPAVTGNHPNNGNVRPATTPKELEHIIEICLPAVQDISFVYVFLLGLTRTSNLSAVSLIMGFFNNSLREVPIAFNVSLETWSALKLVLSLIGVTCIFASFINSIFTQKLIKNIFAIFLRKILYNRFQEEGDFMTTKMLVCYFSASGVTKKAAQQLAQVSGADIYEIKPAVPYTNDDLNWMDKSSRSSVEMRDKNSRPEIADDDAHIENYNAIFVGFPIWWYIAPTIINTFLEKYDFSNKKIILFATSGGSGFGRAADNLRPSVSPTTEIIEGRILNNNPTEFELRQWLATLF